MPYLAPTVPVTILTVTIGVGFLERHKIKDMWQALHQDGGPAMVNVNGEKFVKEEV